MVNCALPLFGVPRIKSVEVGKLDRYRLGATSGFWDILGTCGLPSVRTTCIDGERKERWLISEHRPDAENHVTQLQELDCLCHLIRFFIFSVSDYHPLQNTCLVPFTLRKIITLPPCRYTVSYNTPSRCSIPVPQSAHSAISQQNLSKRS